MLSSLWAISNIMMKIKSIVKESTLRPKISYKVIKCLNDKHFIKNNFSKWSYEHCLYMKINEIGVYLFTYLFIKMVYFIFLVICKSFDIYGY